MGQRLVALAAADPELEIVAALDAAGHPRLGEDAGLVAGIGPIGVPLSSLFASGSPWCYLLTDPQFVTVPPQSGGTADARLAIPGAPALVGLVLHHQFVTADLSTPGALGEALPGEEIDELMV